MSKFFSFYVKQSIFLLIYQIWRYQSDHINRLKMFIVIIFKEVTEIWVIHNKTNLFQNLTFFGDPERQRTFVSREIKK